MVQPASLMFMLHESARASISVQALVVSFAYIPGRISHRYETPRRHRMKPWFVARFNLLRLPEVGVESSLFFCPVKLVSNPQRKYLGCLDYAETYRLSVHRSAITHDKD
jgi:hypothetical protein